MNILEHVKVAFIITIMCIIHYSCSFAKEKQNNKFNSIKFVVEMDNQIIR